MDYKAVLNLMKEMNQTDLTKLEIESEGIRICMEKGSSLPIQTMQQTIPQYINIPGPAQVTPTQETSVQGAPIQAEPVQGAPVTEVPGTKKLTSPMVGTFYAQASPEKPPFVKVGDTVKKGQTICIIEAMKLMNEIESEYDGEIVEILVKNEDMVEFGQPLFVIK